MKRIILSMFLASQISQSVPGKIIFSDGTVIEVPDRIEIINDTNTRIFVKEKSEPRAALTPAQVEALAVIRRFNPKAVLSNEKVSGENLEPRQSKEMEVNRVENVQPIKVIPADSDGSEFIVAFPTYWQKEDGTIDRSEATVFKYLASDIINKNVDAQGFTKRRVET